MRWSYEDLLSGDALPFSKVGHIRQPKVKELKPSGVGMYKYNLYLNCLSWDKKDIVNTFQGATGKNYEKILSSEKLNAFDAMSLIPYSIAFMQEAMGFFIVEKIEWNSEQRAFIVKNETSEEVERIDRENFEDVRDAMLQVNYINVGNRSKPKSFDSDKTKAMWERAQQYLKNAPKKKGDSRMSLGNIISKLSVASSGYTLLNIYELTIFQLYDQFFQCSYLRAIRLNENAFANHGGKKFKFEEWLKPLI